MGGHRKRRWIKGERVGEGEGVNGGDMRAYGQRAI